MRSFSEPVVVVAFDLWNTATNQPVTVVATSHPVTATFGADTVQYWPVLRFPLTIGNTVSGFTPGETIRVTPNIGTIQFSLTQTPGYDTFAWLNYEWVGWKYRIFLGEVGVPFESLPQVYTGTIENISHDTEVATVSVSNAFLDFDKPLVERTYGEDITNETEGMNHASIWAPFTDTVYFTAGNLLNLDVNAGDVHIWESGLDDANLGVELLVYDATATTIRYDRPVIADTAGWSFRTKVAESAKGRTKMEIRGYCRCVEPVLVNEATWAYHVSRRTTIQVTAVYIGGVSWWYVAANPLPGQWTYNPWRGEILLGGTPLNGQVRCDVASWDYSVMTTAKMVRELVQKIGGVINEASAQELDRVANYLIGHAAQEAINIGALLDEVMNAILGAWFVGATGQISVKALQAPSNAIRQQFVPLTVEALRLQQRLTPVKRIQVEYRRNFNPITQFFTGVTEDVKEQFSATGALTSKFENPSVVERYPRAIDMPPIRSLVWGTNDALAIQARAIDVVGRPYAIYEIDARDKALILYDSVRIEYPPVTGVYGRVFGERLSLGEHLKKTTIVWGGPAYVFTDETVALADAMDVPPTNSRLILIDETILLLKQQGIWNDLDVCYFLAAHDSQAARLNWKDPSQFTIVAVNGPVFTQDRGYAGNGTSSRLDTTWIANTHGVRYTQNDASGWIWNRTAGGLAGMEMGASGTAANRTTIRTAAGAFNSYANDSVNNLFGAHTNGASLYGWSRRGATDKRAWIQGAQHGATSADASVGKGPTSSSWFCGANGVQFSTRQLSFGAYGASLAGREYALYETVYRYMNYVGALL